MPQDENDDAAGMAQDDDDAAAAAPFLPPTPWYNENQGEKVGWWHFILKKAFQIAISTVGVTQPLLMGSACSATMASTLSYMDAVFFTLCML